MNEAASTKTTHALSSHSGYVDFFPTVIVNTLAVVLTWNLFIFWAKTNVRCYLWRTTKLQGLALQYSGEGRELALGFLTTAGVFLVLFTYPLLIVISAMHIDLAAMNLPDVGWLGSLILAVVVPVLVSAIGIILIFAPQVETSFLSVSLSAFGLWVGITFILALSRFLTYRYLFRHTHWQATQGDIAGSPWKYAVRMLVPEMSVFLTAGWSSPWRFLRRFDLMLNSATFAGHAIAFKANARKLYLPFSIAWLAFASLTVVQSVLFNVVQPQNPVLLGVFQTVLGLGYFVAIVLAAAYYNARVFAHVAESISLGEVRFRFRSTSAELIKLFLTNLIMNLLSAGFSYYYSRMRIARFIIRHLEIQGEVVTNPGEGGSVERSKEALGEGVEILLASSYF